MNTQAIDRNEATERANQILGLAAAFRTEISKPGQMAYLAALADVPLDDLKRAVLEALRTSKFMPSVAELRQLAGVDVRSETRAIIAFELVGKAISRHGSYESIVFDDPILNATINNLGGWVKICDTPEDTWESFFRRDFLKAYCANFEAKRGTMHAQLGIHDRGNGTAGYEQRQPVLIATELPKVPGLAYERPKVLGALIAECAGRIGVEPREAV